MACRRATNLFDSAQTRVGPGLYAEFSTNKETVMLKRTLALLLAAVYSASFLVTLSVISGCNTVEGAGKDIERGGRAIKEEAREHR